MANPLDIWLAQACGADSLAALPQCLNTARLAALNAQLQWAVQKSPFYARQLADCALPLHDLAALAELPFTTADDLRQWHDLCCVSQGEVQRMVTLQTSGSTGAPKRLGFSYADLGRTAEFFRVGMGQLVQHGQILAVLLPGGERPFGVADLLRRGLTPAGVRVEILPSALARDHSRSGWAALAEWLNALQPQAVVAMPVQLAGLLKRYPHAAPAGVRGVLCSADWLDPALKEDVCRRWQCIFLDHYGLTESCFGCAVECAAHEGYHIRALDCILEIVNPRTLRPVAPGTVGEIVLTTLNREAMPLIRYRTGDAASCITGPCACGSPLPRLGPVLGRWDAAGRVVHPPKGQ